MSSNAPASLTGTPTTAAAPSSAATTTTKTKKAKSTSIKAATSFATMANTGIAVVLGNVVKGLTGNTRFPNPPVDLTALATSLTTFTDAILSAVDGGTKAKAAVAKERKAVIADLKLLAVYVQNNCNDDMTVFASSGFTARQPVKTTGQPLSQSAIKTLDFGAHSGQVTVKIVKQTGAKSYFVRYAPMTNGQPGAFTTVGTTNVGRKVVISGLTPGTLYGFQVQALGSVGYSDWSTLETIYPN
jgi:hypothetical protein